MFYIFHGDDQFTQRETLEQLVAQAGEPAMIDLNTTRLEGKNLTISQLRAACDAIPFLAPVRLVIVEDFLSTNPPRDLVDSLHDYLPQVPESTRLILVESQSLRKNHRLLRLAEAESNGYSRHFSAPEGASLQKWIHKRVEARGGEISPRAVHMLVTNIGNDLGILENEIEKLTLYCGNNVVEAADVAILCPYAAEANIFDLVDALGNRNSQQAAVLLHQKLSEGTDPFFLFAMIVRQFRLLIQIKELEERQLRPPAIAQELGIHGFVAGKLHQQVQHYSASQLETIYAHLLETDVGVKTGKTDMVTALNILIAGVATQ